MRRFAAIHGGALSLSGSALGPDASDVSDSRSRRLFATDADGSPLGRHGLDGDEVVISDRIDAYALALGDPVFQ